MKIADRGVVHDSEQSTGRCAEGGRPSQRKPRDSGEGDGSGGDDHRKR